MSSAAIYQEGLPTLTTTKPRRLGSEIAAPRNLYGLYLPLIMVATTLLCWLVETDFVLLVGSLVLAAVAVYLFYGLLAQQKPVRITTLLVATLGLGYGLGTANTWLTLERSGQGLGEFLHKDPVALTHAMGSVLLSMAITLAVGEFAEKPIFGEDFELQLPPQAQLFLTIATGLIVVAYLKGALSFQGATVSETGHLGVFPAFASWLIGALFAITFVTACNTSRLQQQYFSLLTLVQFFFIIPLGRRVLIFSVVLAALALRLGRFRFRWSWTKRILVGAVLMGVLYAATIGFFYLRLAGFASGKKHLSLGDRISLAYTYFQNKDFAEVQESFSKNVQGRSFVLGYLSELETYSTHYTPGYGRDLEGQFQVALPSVLFPAKSFPGEEALDDELFGSTYLDEANSMLTGGATDFGLLGILAYPLLFAFMLRLFIEFIGESLPTFVAVFIIFAMFSSLLEPENAMTDYFIIMRNGLLFGTVVWFFIALPVFRLRSAQ